jgi:hypothetical protein
VQFYNHPLKNSAGKAVKRLAFDGRREIRMSNGIYPQVVMKWTGHSDYKAMRPYIDIANKTKSDAMKLIDNAWGM